MTEASKHAKLSLDGKTSSFANHISSNTSYNKFLTMKTKTETGKNQKLSRKVPEENVEAAQIISSSPKTLSMI